MAAEERVKAQILVIPDKKCEFCDTNAILWICLNCDEKICEFCKKAHLKSKVARNHKVEYLGEADIRLSSQPDKLTCSTHPDEDIQMFCKPCSKPICRECIASETHLSHKLVKIEDVIQSAQKEISNILAQSQVMINTREDSIKHMGKNQSENSSKMSVAIEEIKAHNTSLKQRLDKITDDFIAEIQTLGRKNKEKTGTTKRKIEEEISMLKRLMEKCGIKQQEEKQLDLIQFVTDTKKELEDIKSADPPDLHNPPEFVVKDVDEQKLKAAFGDLDFKSTPKQEIQKLPVKPTDPLPKPSFDVKVVSNFRVGNGDGVIAAVKDNQAWWLCDYRGKTVRLVTSDGAEVRRITTDFGVCDIAVTKSGELLATVYLKKLKTNGTSIDLWTSGDQGYMTSGITVIDNDDIVVGLCCYTGSAFKVKYQYKVLQLSSSGQLVRTILQHVGTKEILFEFYNPCSVSCNINGDIVVSLRVEGCVIVMDKSGGKRFTYNGQVQAVKSAYSPCYTVTDKYGHILISDINNSAVHMLDKDGNFIKLLVTKQHGLGRPTGMSIDTSGRFWIWHGNSMSGVHNVMVLKYS